MIKFLKQFAVRNEDDADDVITKNVDSIKKNKLDDITDMSILIDDKSNSN